MKRSILLAAILALAPSFAVAQGMCSHGHSTEQVQSCADGSKWDEEAGACMPVVTG